VLLWWLWQSASAGVPGPEWRIWPRDHVSKGRMALYRLDERHTEYSRTQSGQHTKWFFKSDYVHASGLGRNNGLRLRGPLSRSGREDMPTIVESDV
jgi:hypothetical protein